MLPPDLRAKTEPDKSRAIVRVEEYGESSALASITAIFLEQARGYVEKAIESATKASLKTEKGVWWIHPKAAPLPSVMQ